MRAHSDEDYDGLSIFDEELDVKIFEDWSEKSKQQEVEEILVSHFVQDQKREFDQWILDSGASFHITSNKHWFDHLHESNHGNVVVWGGVAYNITGIGDVTVRFDSGFVHTLKGVRVREKLEPRAMKFVFLGYHEGVKGYRLWDRSQNGVKIIISRDVKFNESEMPRLESEKQQETISGESLVEVERVSITLPVSPSEVESDNQQDQHVVENEWVEDVIEDHHIDQNPLADYQLARDRKRRPRREPQRMSDYTIAYASYHELVDSKDGKKICRPEPAPRPAYSDNRDGSGVGFFAP
ncbi:Retrovirus-related Pol polyprotein from transposon TNT 1-94 [Abeliophyllum distichum]|uniref:Retrovirus-related Pol polyprotein from transposon TNT 1-94 n=1 Tax=Abeliophyllum distichum TaxID=126358 RepID=A0ABD1TEV7_9LAMI